MTLEESNTPANADATTPDPDAEGGETSPGGETDYQQLYEESQTASNELATRVDKAEAAAEARMRQLETLVTKAFNREPEVEEPAPTPQLSEEQVESLTPTQMIQYANMLAQRQIQENNKKVAAGLRSLYDTNHAQAMKDLSGKDPELYELVQEELEQHFEDNPSDKYVPGRATSKYNELVGKNLSKVKEKITAVAPVAPITPSPPGTPRPASPGTPGGETPAASKLTADESRIAKIYGMEEKEYLAWKAMEDDSLAPERRV